MIAWIMLLKIWRQNGGINETPIIVELKKKRAV